MIAYMEEWGQLVFLGKIPQNSGKYTFAGIVEEHPAFIREGWSGSGLYRIQKRRCFNQIG
jgi:hypothetical protein